MQTPIPSSGPHDSTVFLIWSSFFQNELRRDVRNRFRTTKGPLQVPALGVTEVLFEFFSLPQCRLPKNRMIACQSSPHGKTAGHRVPG